MIVFLMSASMLCGCQSNIDVSEMPDPPVNINRLLVMPFQDISMGGQENRDTRCPVCGKVFITGAVADGAADLLTKRLISWLEKNRKYELIIPDASANIQTMRYPQGTSMAASLNESTWVGRSQDADGVLIGYLYRFRERVGKGYSVESPASVAFELHLIGVAEGRSIWSASYDETQQPLGENLFQLGSFLSRGGRWVSAEELAFSGLEQILKKFPSP